MNITEEKKFTVLIVDDETSNIDVLNHILKDKYKLFIAKNGENAIKIARERSPDLILLDVVMPGMNGFQVLNELKSSDLTENIPVIFITGKDSKEDEVQGLSLGAVDYITKPFYNVIVEARIRTHMRIVEQMRIIERMSIMDELTDLPNRRYFNDQLNREWGRAIRETSPVSVLIIDVDKFKAYNDTFGHQQGDSLLQTLAGIFRQSLMRASDFVARWGGEEFIMVMPQTDEAGVATVAERVRASVEDAALPCKNELSNIVTISIGVHTENPVAGQSVAGLISKADKALYTAKETGRNKVCVYKPGM